MIKKSLICLSLLASFQCAAGSKLLGTAAVNHIEGSAGGGLTPWAVLSGYATDSEWGAATFMSSASVDDYALNAMGFALNYHDKLELSYAKLNFSIDAGLPDIDMDVFGAKYHAFGDVVYGDMPQISIGIQHKKVKDFTVPAAVGASDDAGTDLYISAAKAWLDGPFNRTFVVNLNARMSKANQIGLLGFGSAQDNGYKVSLEAAVALFVTRNLVIGTEYKQKKGHLAGLKEDDWHDVFVAYLVNKSLSITAAYIDLGDIAGASEQRGYYLSLQGAF